MKTARTRKIFLDSSDPEDTKRILDSINHLDGQTTNPSLLYHALSESNRSIHSEEELLSAYRELAIDISHLIPKGSVSLEVYADETTKADAIVKQAREMNAWIPNAHIKLPIIPEAMRAAELLLSENVRLNMTLVFSQEQAAAVASLAQLYPNSDVFVSSFIGRLDDRGENGMDLIVNIRRMYDAWHSSVSILAASIRNMDHLLVAYQAGADIVTAPFPILREWDETGCLSADETFTYDIKHKTSIIYKELPLDSHWSDFDIHHELTKIGLEKFAHDWNNML